MSGELEMAASGPLPGGEGRAAFPARPWLTIFTRPRATMRAIIASDPERYVVLIACLSGVLSAIDRASDRTLGDQMAWPWILLAAAILGSIFGYLWLLIYGGLVRWTGEWLGGAASSEDVRAAIAWPNVALVPAALFYVAEITFFGDELFTSDEPSIGFVWLSLVHMGVGVPMAIWWVVLLAKCVGEVQQFSAWKGLGNLVIALLMAISPFITIALAVHLAA
ncbi:MAG: YIP1 family protein [Alphaproteobacteria bacterium]|nr:MAG: YIP1 family protein [Alphaproteobacteria bacterium]